MKRLTLVLFIILTLCMPVLAQDATAEATDTAPVIVNVESPAQPVDSTSNANILTIVLTSVVSFVVGAGTGLGMAARWIKEAINDPVKMTLAEKVGNSIPQESVQGFVDFLDSAKAFIIEATDRKPMVTKPATVTGETESVSTPPTTYTTTPMRITPPPSGPFGG